MNSLLSQITSSISFLIGNDFKNPVVSDLRMAEDLSTLCSQNIKEALAAREALIDSSMKLSEDAIVIRDAVFLPSLIQTGYDVTISQGVKKEFTDLYFPMFKPVTSRAAQVFANRQKEVILVSDEIATRRIDDEMDKLNISFLHAFMANGKGFEDAHLVLAGGFVSACTLDEPMFEYITEKTPLNGAENPYEKSDLDFFVLGKDLDAKRNLLRKILTKISAEKESVLEHYGAVFKFTHLSREIQIIFSEAENIEQLLSDFDMSHIQCGYSRGTIRTTSLFRLFTPEKKTLITATRQSPNRLKKALNRGFLPVYGGKIHTLKDQYWYAESIKNGSFIGFDSDFIETKISKDEKKEKVVEVSPKTPMIYNVSGKTLCYNDEEKRTDIPWEVINISRAIEITENIEALHISFAQYQSMNTTLPVSDTYDDSSNASITKVDLFDCTIDSICVDVSGKPTSMYVSGFAMVNDLDSLKDGVVMDLVTEEFLKVEKRNTEAFERWVEIVAQSGKVMRERITELSAKKEKTKKEKVELRRITSQYKSVVDRFEHIKNLENKFNPATISDPILACIINRKLNKITNDELFESQVNHKVKAMKIGQLDRAISQILHNHPHGKCFLRNDLTQPRGKLISFSHSKISLSPEYPATITLFNGDLISIEKAYELGLKVNMSCRINGYELLIPAKPFDIKEKKYESYNDATTFIYTAKRFYTEEGVKFETEEDFLIAMGKDLVENKKFREYTAECFDRSPKRIPGFPGKSAVFTFSSAYAIKK